MRMSGKLVGVFADGRAIGHCLSVSSGNDSQINNGLALSSHQQFVAQEVRL
jgi:hypothetical protein